MRLKKSILVFSVLLAAANAQAQTDADQKGLPSLIQVAAGNALVLEASAEGKITYECSKEKDPLTTYKWVMVGPNAVLKNSEGQEIGDYSGPPARWASKDGSFVTGSQVAVSRNGEKNIPYQLVKADVSGGFGVMTAVSYVQRVNTQGGVAPARKCTADNAGDKVDVDYTADYRFWKTN